MVPQITAGKLKLVGNNNIKIGCKGTGPVSVD
jgi:hypothetical protein